MKLGLAIEEGDTGEYADEKKDRLIAKRLIGEDPIFAPQRHLQAFSLDSGFQSRYPRGKMPLPHYRRLRSHFLSGMNSLFQNVVPEFFVQRVGSR